MIAVYVAVCLASTAVNDCNRSTAVYFGAAPEVQQNLAMCSHYGQQLLAQTELAQSGTYTKIFCQKGPRRNIH